MKSSKRGKNISQVEILAIHPNGLWILLFDKEEYFLDFGIFPWFKNAKVSDIYNVELLQCEHLYWPTLDIDLELESIFHPEKYPLIAGN